MHHSIIAHGASKPTALGEVTQSLDPWQVKYFNGQTVSHPIHWGADCTSCQPEARTRRRVPQGSHCPVCRADMWCVSVEAFSFSGRVAHLSVQGREAKEQQSVFILNDIREGSHN
ncbi:hypothetical protein AVEN_220008-1 [Araneus ventricosus]|uniref:Uncharacterized protein n=1 Tax=Araneus ventricosus TaxID=182803 RepID=A0A4Y2CSB3_ARAVE|nr:hypothetical protein AVEN_220008-1 [Araneus ventricosus]